jgi:hypothetical protein
MNVCPFLCSNVLARYMVFKKQQVQSGKRLHLLLNPLVVLLIGEC